MRRWVCIVTLLAGFSAADPAWSTRPRPAVPIERRLDSLDHRGGRMPTLAWWLPNRGPAFASTAGRTPA